MKVKALTNFCGSPCMAKGEIRECSDETVLADLLGAGYIELAEEKPEESSEELESAEEKPDEFEREQEKPGKSGGKRASGSKGADSGEGE